jgi:hypothetical protein
MRILKRYQFFTFPDYYPNGGGGDIEAEADTLEELKEILLKPINGISENHQVLDLQERRWLDDSEYKFIIDAYYES